MLNIIIPYRDREEHLNVFIKEFNNFIKLDYKITVVEQLNDRAFNRAKLLNIGFDINKENGYFCFHDVDMIPIEADYSYPEEPIHMATNASQFEYNLPFNDYYGGVNLFNKKDFIRVNGYSNDYWGWGIEDDDLLKRVINSGFKLLRRKGVYKSLEHLKSEINHEYRTNSLSKYYSNYDFRKDGLNNLNYDVIDQEIISDKVTVIKVNF
jgi:predicted glycosyltransferase involved in capsule biosynthesis